MRSAGQEDWLLVLDNYDDIRVELRRFLPTGATGNVIITSRDRRVIGSIAQSGLTLSAMDLADAKQLFRLIRGRDECSLTSETQSKVEEESLEQILQELQCFPLAIDQAASFIRENGPMTSQEYLHYLKPRTIDRERLMRFKEAIPKYPESVMTTWEISLQYLEETQPRASWILHVLGFLDHSYIAEEQLTDATKVRPWSFDIDCEGRKLPPDVRGEMGHLDDDVGFRIAIGTLTSLSLVKRNTSPPTLYVHPPVHEWTRVRLNSNPAQQARYAIAAAMVVYQTFPIELVAWLPQTFPIILPEHHRRIDQALHHLGAVMANIQDYGEYAVDLPVECIILLEIVYLAGTQSHIIYALEISEQLSTRLDLVIRNMVRLLSQKSKSMAVFVHKVVIWLQGKTGFNRQFGSSNRDCEVF